MSDLQRAIDYLMAHIHNNLLAEKEDGKLDARCGRIRRWSDGLHADPGERPAGHGAGAPTDGDFDHDDTEGKGMSEQRNYPTRMHEVLGVWE